MTWFKRIGVSLAALVVLAVLGGGVYGWRSMPSLNGSLSAPGLSKPVSVQRDSADVTHIKAQTMPDAAYALGYVHAQERSWQLEFNRRLMHGQLSEILGPATLDTDKLIRTLGILRAGQAQFDALPLDAKAVLQAYANGINTFHATSSQALPPEFHVLGTKPGTWLPADTMGWSTMMALDLGGNWGTEFGRLSAAQKVGTAQLWQLFPAYPGEAPATQVDLAKLYADLGVYKTAVSGSATTPTIASVAPNNGASCAGNTWLCALFSGKNKLQSALQIALFDNAALHADAASFARDVGNVEGKGSNNWVLAGSKTTSGKPLLANDPHLALSAPAIWYFARIQVAAGGDGGAAKTNATDPDIDVIGATLPGLPTVVLGRTAKVAWGFTNTGPDVQDLYLEQINPDNPAQYRRPLPEGVDPKVVKFNPWQNFEMRTETFHIKGQPSLVHTVRSTRHGPVISDAQPTHADVLDLKKYVIALRWSALESDNGTILAGLRANKAQNVDELLAAYANYHSPMQNLVAADISGKIAYKAIGKVPTRRADNDLKGIAPAPGWESKYDWTGWLPYAQTPQDDGKKGWVATANQRIHAADFPHFMGQDWAFPQRFDRIETLLAAKPQHDMASMQAIQADTVSLATQALLPVLHGTTSTHALASTALAHMHHFDGDMKADSAAPLVFATWADELTRALLVPKLGAAKFKALYGKRHFRAALETIMLSKDAYWCAPKSCEQQSNDALTRALDRLQTLYTSDITTWQWGKAHEARSTHKPLGNVPVMAKWFDVTVPTGGDPWTVNVGQYWANEKHPFHNRHAASMRTLYDMADLEKSQFIYQTGQSGLVFSNRYRDMRQQWGSGQTRDLQLNPASFVSSQTLNP